MGLLTRGVAVTSECRAATGDGDAALWWPPGRDRSVG
jgi:hypothetical protein